MEATTPCCRFCFITLALPAVCQTLLSFTLTGSVANNNRVNLRGETCIADIDDNMFNSGVSKGNVILWKSRSALLPSFREVINVRTFTCPEKVFPSANWQIPSDSEIAFRLGLPEQQCIKGKTDEEGSHSNIKFNMLISMK